MEVKANKKSISSGIYLVIDPSMEEQVLLKKLQIVLTKEIAAVQVWDNFKADQDITGLIGKIQFLCAQHRTPVLINNRWEYLTATGLDGVHFDAVPDDLDQIRKKIRKASILGLTCGNDLADVGWAVEQGIDYISFCSMFPSSSVGDCEIIAYGTVKKARSIFDGPLFLAGGICPENLKRLDGLKYDGIAVISGIMDSENPGRAMDEYHENLKSIK